jgi:hypothetical protein
MLINTKPPPNSHHEGHEEKPSIWSRTALQCNIPNSFIAEETFSPRWAQRTRSFEKDHAGPWHEKADIAYGGNDAA